MIGPGFHCLFSEHPSLDRLCTSCCCPFSHSDFIWCSPHFFVSFRTSWCAPFSSLPPQCSCAWSPDLLFGLLLLCSWLTFSKSIFASSCTGLHPAPFFFFLLPRERILSFIFFYKTMIPCVPQLDVVMYVHLIRCHRGPEDAIQLRRSFLFHASTKKKLHQASGKTAFERHQNDFVVLSLSLFSFWVLFFVAKACFLKF